MFPGILVPIAIFFGLSVIVSGAIAEEAVKNIKR